MDEISFDIIIYFSMITLQILFPLAIIKYMKFFIKGQSKFGSSLSLPAYGREGQGQHLLFRRRFSRSEKQNSAAAKARAGREFIFPHSLPFCPPERSVSAIPPTTGAIIRSFVQNRFELRLVIATNQDILKIQRRLFARSPRRRRGERANISS